eukprot:1622504-Rhodomonas_salina.2
MRCYAATLRNEVQAVTYLVQTVRKLCRIAIDFAAHSRRVVAERDGHRKPLRSARRCAAKSKPKKPRPWHHVQCSVLTQAITRQQTRKSRKSISTETAWDQVWASRSLRDVRYRASVSICQEPACYAIPGTDLAHRATSIEMSACAMTSPAVTLCDFRGDRDPGRCPNAQPLCDFCQLSHKQGNLPTSFLHLCTWLEALTHRTALSSLPLPKLVECAVRYKHSLPPPLSCVFQYIAYLIRSWYAMSGTDMAMLLPGDGRGNATTSPSAGTDIGYAFAMRSASLGLSTIPEALKIAYPAVQQPPI